MTGGSPIVKRSTVGSSELRVKFDSAETAQNVPRGTLRKSGLVEIRSNGATHRHSKAYGTDQDLRAEMAEENCIDGIKLSRAAVEKISNWLSRGP